MEQNKKVCKELTRAWADMSPGWYAAAKERYFNRIFSVLLDTAEDVYRRNEELERYSREILESIRGE